VTAAEQIDKIQMMKPAFIRTIEMQDAVVISALSHQLGYPATPEESLRRISAVLQHPDHCAFVAVAGDHVAGWIHGFHTINLESDPFVAIAGLVVDEAHRRMGFGKALVDKVIDWSVLKKCGRVRVRCNAARKASHLFYEALDFREMKEQKVFDRQMDKF
jgi:GNAT superfamily N-acetyltransferase